MPRLSLAMIVKNEAHTLGRALESVRGLCEEVVVVDTGSTDRTVEIAQSFLTRQSERMGRDNMRFAHDAEQAIRHYPWPGNVRELENAIERSVILCEGSDISAELLGIDIELDDLEDDDFTEQSLQQGSSGNHEPTEDLSLEDYFQHFVLEHQDHMTETELARKLGISRKCLWERRQRLGIPRRKSGAATGS